MAVIGVFKSWEILLMSSLLSLSYWTFSSVVSFKRMRISSKSWQSWLISSLLSISTSKVKSRFPFLISLVAIWSLFRGANNALYTQPVSIIPVSIRIIIPENKISTNIDFTSGMKSPTLDTINTVPSSLSLNRKSTCLIKFWVSPSK